MKNSTTFHRSLKRAALCPRPLLPYLCLFIGLRLYHLVSTSFHFFFQSRQFIFEIPLLFMIFGCTQAFLKPTRYIWLWASLPIALLYLVHDAYLLVYGQVPNFKDANRIPELFGVMPLSTLVIFSALTALCLGLARQVDIKRVASRRILLLLPLVLLTLLSWQEPKYIKNVIRDNMKLGDWSSLHNARQYGRLVMAIVRDTDYRAAYQELFDKSAKNHAAFIPKPIELRHPRNIVLVVLESFVDTRRFSKVELSQPSVHANLAAILKNTQSSTLSPLPYSGTAKSEFSVLCGLPALGLFGREEFKMLGDNSVPCLPRRVVDAGLKARAYHAYKGELYNRLRVYPALGFESMSFIDAGELRLRRPKERKGHILDREFYEQVLHTIDPQAPALTHMLTMEGHSPYELDKSQAPMIQISPKNEMGAYLANKSYYRTQALAWFSNALHTRDPNALLIAFGDHLAPVPSGSHTFYNTMGYRGVAQKNPKEIRREQFLMVVDAGEVVEVGDLRHQDLGGLVIQALEGHPLGNISRISPAEEKHNYTQFMRSALR